MGRPKGSSPTCSRCGKKGHDAGHCASPKQGLPASGGPQGGPTPPGGPSGPEPSWKEASRGFSGGQQPGQPGGQPGVIPFVGDALWDGISSGLNVLARDPDNGADNKPFAPTPDQKGAMTAALNAVMVAKGLTVSPGWGLVMVVGMVYIMPVFTHPEVIPNMSRNIIEAVTMWKEAWSEWKSDAAEKARKKRKVSEAKELPESPKGEAK